MIKSAKIVKMEDTAPEIRFYVDFAVTVRKGCIPYEESKLIIFDRDSRL